MNAPERIWTETDQFGPHWRGPDILNGMTEFVRADLFAALEAKAQDLQAKLTECCLQCLATDGQADEALARAEKAEAERDDALCFLDDAVSSSPAPIKELGEYLSRILGEDQWATAERYLNAAAVSASELAARADRTEALLKEAVEALEMLDLHANKYHVTPTFSEAVLRRAHGAAKEVARATLARIKEDKDNG